MLASIGLDRTEVYIANIVKCRPPNNRDPQTDEQDACIGYLENQIRLVSPDIIVCLGRIAAGRMIHENFKITKEHGLWFEYNGIKIFSGDGFKLPDALEERIEDILLNRVNEPEVVSGEGIGKITVRPSAAKDYIDHLKSSVPYSLDGMRVAVDCANGSASVTAEKLFTSLGADVHLMFHTPDGVNINRGCGSNHMEALAQYVAENDLDAGVAFDGDADRCLCVDETGKLIDGDVIMAICAADMAERGKLSRKRSSAPS